MSFVEILSGIVLTLFGVDSLKKGLHHLSGGRLNHWLARVSTCRFRAFSAGVAAGTATPSSTGLSLMAAHLVRDSRLQAAGVLAMLLGANAGMSVSVQAMAFHVQDHAAPIIAGGILVMLYGQREWLRGFGQCVMSFGFVFLAIGWIGHGARSLAESPTALAFFASLEGSPWEVLFATLALAVVLQSSGAALAVGLGLCASGLVGAAVMLPWVAGSGLGVGVSTIIAGWRSTAGRRLGVGSIVAKCGIALPLMLFPEAAQAAFQALPGSLARQTAIACTLFHLLCGLAALPFLPALWRLASALIPGPAAEASALGLPGEGNRRPGDRHD